MKLLAAPESTATMRFLESTLPTELVSISKELTSTFRRGLVFPGIACHLLLFVVVFNGG